MNEFGSLMNQKTFIIIDRPSVIFMLSRRARMGGHEGSCGGRYRQDPRKNRGTIL